MKLRLLLITLAAGALWAQADSGPTTLVSPVIVSSVKDIRPNYCHVALRLDDATGTYSIHDLRIVAATDDTGRDLRLDKGSNVPHPFNISSNSLYYVYLKNPVRAARFITVLEGEVDLFQPRPDNDSKLVIKDFQAHPGEWLESSELQKAGIHLLYVTPDTTNTVREKFNALVAKRPTWEKEAALLQQSRNDLRLQNAVQLLCDDPDKRLVDVSYQDAAGNPIEKRGGAAGYAYSTGHFTHSFEHPLPADAQLVVYVATPASIKTVPFRLENIALP